VSIGGFGTVHKNPDRTDSIFLSFGSNRDRCRAVGHGDLLAMPPDSYTPVLPENLIRPRLLTF
jgi:hypothetical protein